MRNAPTVAKVRLSSPSSSYTRHGRARTRARGPADAMVGVAIRRFAILALLAAACSSGDRSCLESPLKPEQQSNRRP